MRTAIDWSAIKLRHCSRRTSGVPKKRCDVSGGAH
jgi:hypothetical protein